MGLQYPKISAVGCVVEGHLQGVGATSVVQQQDERQTYRVRQTDKPLQNF